MRPHIERCHATGKFRRSRKCRDVLGTVCNVKKNVNVVYSGHALSFEIATLGMPLKHRKQITLNEHNTVKNPNWLEADQLAIYKA